MWNTKIWLNAFWILALDGDDLWASRCGFFTPEKETAVGNEDGSRVTLGIMYKRESYTDVIWNKPNMRWKWITHGVISLGNAYRYLLEV